MFLLKASLAAAAVLGLAGAAAQADLTLVPRPKSVAAVGAEPLSLASAVIVIGDRASEPEQYAAEMLQMYTQRRFGLKLPISHESDNPQARTLIALGQRGTCRLIDRLCKQWMVDLSEQSPGMDGYVIRFGADGGRNVAIVGGSNARGVIYGQDTLFQLMEKRGWSVVLRQAQIRDWPSIPWRGRVRTSFSQHNREGTFDAMAQARLNFIDVRDAPDTFGTPAGRKLDGPGIRAVIAQAHRRGMIVYGQLNCAVTKDKYDAAIQTFRDFIDLGVDGLWMSFPDARYAEDNGMRAELVQRVVELGKKHRMAGHLIAIQPSKESYRHINTDPDKEIAAVDGMADALWFFAVKPNKQSRIDGQTIGLRTKPCWWDHWPRPRIGFDFRDNFSQRPDRKPAYTNLMPLSEAYETPSWEELADAANNTSGVMPWGGSEWGTEYVTHTLGFWAWAPELHNWQEERARIYDIVFGPTAVRSVMQFDDILGKAEELIKTPEAPGGEVFTYPGAITSKEDLAAVAKAADELQAPLKQIQSTAKRETLLSADLLEKYYLEPMSGSVEAARAAASREVGPVPPPWDHK